LHSNATLDKHQIHVNSNHERIDRKGLALQQNRHAENHRALAGYGIVEANIDERL
jgi:hypothetical protein